MRGQQLNLKYLIKSSPKPYRVAVVVSRKVSKSAVIRNRIRRRIYAAVRQQSTEIKPGADLVFTAYSDQLTKLPAEKLQGQIGELLQKAK